MVGSRSAEEATQAGTIEPVSHPSPPPAPIQTIYREGVPHTTRHGEILTRYDPQRSFFPIGLWGVPESAERGGVNYDWSRMAEAGYNTAWPWPTGGYTSEAQLSHGVAAGLQVILMRRPTPDAVRRLRNEFPSFLGIVWRDEPMLQPGYSDQWLEEFREYRTAVKTAAPNLLVFANTCSWITHSDWTEWNLAGDVSCHDNYPVWPVTGSINRGSFGTSHNGIAHSVSLAVAANGEQKPVWLIVGVFEVAGPPDERFPFRYPTPRQLRAIVYAGLIHGVTGITYFTWDSPISRAGRVIGISPDPRASYAADRSSAAPMQLIMARALWDAAAHINTELGRLTPVILAPTVGEDVGYSLEVEGEPVTESPIRALLKPHPERGFVLLTVNLDNAVLKARIAFESPLTRVQPLFENRSEMEISSGTRAFTVDYEPFDTHVLHLELGDTDDEGDRG